MSLQPSAAARRRRRPPPPAAAAAAAADRRRRRPPPPPPFAAAVRRRRPPPPAAAADPERTTTGRCASLRRLQRCPNNCIRASHALSRAPSLSAGLLTRHQPPPNVTADRPLFRPKSPPPNLCRHPPSRSVLPTLVWGTSECLTPCLVLRPLPTLPPMVADNLF